MNVTTVYRVNRLSEKYLSSLRLEKYFIRFVGSRRHQGRPRPRWPNQIQSLEAPCDLIRTSS